ncbi:DUF58 domain-containing protein [Pseudonocardia spinosispora]|uniref:DUF58 domain-containing protein n=1 Tax=Pseudonocardia spinosispora TaxID=103441 RepID=UPI0004126FA4|nr:DUF58 domain-containing protein [Pseudonocardia spinosispora]
MADAPSGLSTLGRCLIAAGVASSVCSAALNERDLLRIGLFAVALPLLAALLAGRTRLVVNANRSVRPTRVSRGSPVETNIEVHTASRLLGGGLVFTDALPDALGTSARFVTAPPRKSDPPMELRYPITPRVRGLHQIGPLTVRVSDPLGLVEYERELVGRTTLTVLPRVTPLSGLPDGFGRGEGDSGSTGLRRGPGEHDALLREYQPGDALRTVHWKSTARRDELMVRLEERPWHGGVTVLLDRRVQAHRGAGAEASLEWAIELAASVCQHLLAHGRTVTLVAENGVTLASGRDSDALLDSLATVRPSNQPGLIAPPANGGELFAVLGAVDTLTLDPLIKGAGGHGHAVLLDVRAWAGPHESRKDAGVATPARALTDAGWTVLVGKPERGPDKVWNEFCQRLPVRLGTGR